MPTVATFESTCQLSHEWLQKLVGNPADEAHVSLRTVLHAVRNRTIEEAAPVSAQLP